MRKAKREIYGRHVAVLMFLLFRDVAYKNKIKLADVRDNIRGNNSARSTDRFSRSIARRLQ